MNTGLLCVLGLLSLGLVTLVAALLFGGPGPAPEMASISNPFKTLDWSGLPSPATGTPRGAGALLRGAGHGPARPQGRYPAPPEHAGADPRAQIRRQIVAHPAGQ